ncbi:MAG: hypothetical protein ACREI7_00690, partial [Myxococcota bacterium]
LRRRVNGNTAARAARRASRASRMAAAALAAWLCSAAVIASAADAEPRKRRPPREPTTEEGSVVGESTWFGATPFAELDISDAFRIHTETFAAPDASLGSGHVTVVRPELGVRVTVPASERLVLRLVTRVAESRYRFRGDVWGAAVSLPFTVIPDGDELIGDRLDLHSARVAFEGAYRLSDDTNWLAEGEQWSLLGSAYIGSRWEDGDFESGLHAGGALGVGYEIPNVLRLALGASLRTPLDAADFDADPFVALRWRPFDWLTVRSRELGGQVEFELIPAFDFYVTGFRSSDTYRLRDRFDPLGDLSFRDRHLRFGAGVDWKVWWLRVGLEAGALTNRRLRVSEEDRGTLLSRRADTSAYFEIRFELRL